VDLGLHTEARAFALWAEARRAPLDLAAIEPLLEAMQRRLLEVSTSSTLLALVLVDVLRVSGHVERARELTAEIVAFAIAHGERVYLPELLRVRGEQRATIDEALRDHEEAVELARSTGALAFERRAEEGLAALRKRTGAR
jgi:hypothetical protein